ncbi:MAG: biotin/lipoyl-binding protein [Chloracidobacterium sp.]|nr:biotin/lipoyl-binding protein [Chloracidobacterium sp.]
MKLQAKINGEKLDIEIVEQDGKTRAVVGGREYKLEISQPEPGIFALRNGQKMTEAFVSPDGKQVVVGGNEFEVEIADPKRLRSVGSESEYVDGVAEIKTAMPGKVVRILVKVGAAVEKGDGVIVVEAMKMQNEMRSPKTGTVTKINASEGDTVNAGDVLAVIE